MNLAASTWNYSSALKAGLPFSQMMEEIYDQALGIEFWLATLESGQISQYEQQYKGKFPFVSCHTSQANSFSEEILLNEIKLCHRLGAKILVVHPVSLGYTAHTWDYSYKKRYDAVLLSKVGMYAELAARLGLCLALENGPIEVLEEVIDFAGGKIFRRPRYLYRYGMHPCMRVKILKCPEAPEDFQRTLVQLHVHDNLG